MNLEIASVLIILAVALVLFISEVLRMDLVALLVLSALALLGLVSPTEALSGFSNAAVVTVWAMFILSEGLTRTGIANILGRQVMKMAGRREVPLIVVIMVTSGGLSAFMNNIGVAALMLPVVIDIARRTAVPPSRLLMPLAFGCLLGGLTTLIGTPPNLLVSGALAQNGEDPFSLFDFAPVGIGAALAGTAFMALLGRLFLPRRDPAAEGRRSQRNLRAQYGLQERTFVIEIPAQSVVVGKTLSDTRISSAAGLIIIALERNGHVDTLPPRKTRLAAGDKLLVQGRLDRFNEIRRWSELVIEREAPVMQGLMSDRIRLMEVTVAGNSNLIKELLHHTDFRRRFRTNVLAIRRKDLVRRVNLSYVPIRAGDSLLLQGSEEAFEELEKSPEFSEIRPVSEEDVTHVYRLQERIFVVRVPKDSGLGGSTLAQSRIGDAFDFRLLATFREGSLKIMPEPDEVILGGDLLLIQGRAEDLDVLRGLQEIEVRENVSPNLNVFESDRLATAETTLSPQSTLAGKRVADINFREKYGLELIAIWRSGQAIRSDLESQTIQFGDALLFVGPRQKLLLLNKEPDLLVLSGISAAPATDDRRAPLAAAIMGGVVLSVLAGLLPIAIAAVFGASLMVLTGCLNMEQAYRSIDWRAVFLIAGMLPLGIAMQETGTAEYLAGKVMNGLGEYGPWPVIMGLYAVTAIATMIIPTAALVVLMSPIVLSASAEMGIAPQTAMMAIAMAASASFTSPISHPANILVMGPGGYRFADYIKLGIPLTLVVFVAVMLFLPVFWPLQNI